MAVRILQECLMMLRYDYAIGNEDYLRFMT